MAVNRGSAVAVVGAGLGGLATAIRLRQAGHPVTIYEANQQVGGRASQISAEGFTFDTGPTLLNYPWVFAELFRDAGRELGAYVDLLPVDPSITFFWPDGVSFALSGDLPRLTAGVERIEPGGAVGLMRFLAENERKYRLSFERLVCRNVDNPLRWLWPLSFGELRVLGVHTTLERNLGRFFRRQHLRDAFGAYAMYLGGSPHALPGLYTILAYGELAHGLWLPRGGIYGLIQGVERLARELGVQIHLGRRVREIVTERSAVQGVLQEDGSLEKHSVVVSNVDVPTTKTMLLGEDSGVDRSWSGLRRFRMTPSVMTFYWGVRGHPTGMGHHSIFFPEDVERAYSQLLQEGRIPDRPPFYLSVASATDPELAPDNAAAVFGLVPLPLCSRLGKQDWPALTALLKGQIFARLREQGIGLEERQIVFERVWTPADWASRFGLHDGSAFGAAHGLLQVGPFRFRNYEKKIRGLYYTGASTTPGTGLPMVVLGARLTAERIADHVS